MAGKTMTQMFQDIGFSVVTMDGPRPPGIPSHDEIIASEAAGQAELVNSTLLPFKTEGQGHAAFEALGIKLGDKVVDDLFVEAVLPEGWVKKAASDHNMWSYVYDQHGRERIAVFYKAAVYDRRATMNLVARFSVRQEGQDPDWKSPQRWIVTDAGTPEFATDWFTHDDYEAGRQAHDEVVAWLGEHYPDWKDPTAYWDEAPK